jgi:glycosyltransferase involved in cell wall biosynthesis
MAGGSVGHTKGVIDGFVAAGFQVDYASVKPMPTDAPGAVWRHVPAPSLYAFPPELNYYTFNRRYERFVEKMLKGRSYAFLYQRSSLHNFSGVRLRQRLGLPLVVEYNGSEAWASANWAEKLTLHDMAVAAERASVRNADLVVTVSKPLHDEVAAAGVPPERIVTHPNCIDPVIFDPGRFSRTDRAALRARWGIADDALVATFIGTFGTWHGVDFLARAVRRLIDQSVDFVERHRLHFLFVGDGLKMSEVRAAIGEAPYARFVTLTGLVRQAEAPAFLAASDMFLSPHMPNPDGTPFFGSPTKLFEYMAMERPIIASDLDQIGEVLQAGPATGGRLAELYKPGDMDGLLMALRHVVENLGEARQMARRARHAALSAYTWKHHVGAIVNRLRELGILPSS